MTAKERNLWLGVGVIIVGTLIFNYFFGHRGDVSEKSSPSLMDFRTASHLLESQHNIQARSRAAAERLQQLEEKFFPAAAAEQAQVGLLETVETLASASNLPVSQKNMVRLSGNVIGVALEGKATAEALVRLLQEAGGNRYGLKLKRMQIHSLPEQRLLSYQLVLVSLLIEKKGKTL